MAKVDQGGGGSNKAFYAEDGCSCAVGSPPRGLTAPGALTALLLGLLALYRRRSR